MFRQIIFPAAEKAWKGEPSKIMNNLKNQIMKKIARK